MHLCSNHGKTKPIPLCTIIIQSIQQTQQASILHTRHDSMTEHLPKKVYERGQLKQITHTQPSTDAATQSLQKCYREIQDYTVVTES